MIRALWDALLFLVGVWWLDRRLAAIYDALMLPPEPDPAAQPAFLVHVDDAPAPPPIAARCPATRGERGERRCSLEEGHKGDHASSTGVSWA